MNDKVQRVAKDVRGFLKEVGDEFRRTSWPERRELVESTVVVASFIVLLAGVVMICDEAIKSLLRLIHA